MRSSLLGLLVVSAALLMANNRSHAEGAIAEGIAPGGIAKGYKYGIVAGLSDKDSAQDRALARCREPLKRTLSGKLASRSLEAAAQRCNIVVAFKDQCAAVALDPKDGTPGAGWATGVTRKHELLPV